MIDDYSPCLYPSSLSEDVEWYHEEPDMIETPWGYAPNYEKFESLGMTPEEALIYCNLD